MVIFPGKVRQEHRAEVNSAPSNGTVVTTIVPAFEAVLNSELGYSGPEIGAQAGGYAYQEQSFAQLATGLTQKALRSGMGILPLFSSTSACNSVRMLGLILQISPTLQTKTEAQERPQHGPEHKQLREVSTAIESL
jgi:hypothetical protein